MTAFAIETPPEFSVQDSVIDSMAAEYLSLTVEGAEDKSGLERVHEARMEVKRTRIAVEKRRKELKADALKYGQAIDAEARRIKEKLTPIEEHLQEQEDVVRREKERIAREKEEMRLAKVRDRLSKLNACDCHLMPVEVEALTDSDFAELLQSKQEEKRKRDEQAKREAEERRKEEARLKAEREELERQRREQEAERERLEAERQKVEAEAAEQRRQTELEKAKLEAAERAAREERERLEREAEQAKAKAEREAAEAKAKAEREEAERKEREARMPDHQKLVRFAEQLRHITPPSLSVHSKHEEAEVADALNQLQETVCSIAMRLDPEVES